MNRTIAEVTNTKRIVHLKDMDNTWFTLCKEKWQGSTYGGHYIHSPFEKTFGNELPTCPECLRVYLRMLEKEEK